MGNLFEILERPDLDFAEVSIEMGPEHNERFKELIRQGVPIEYHVYTMPNLSAEIEVLLSEHGYRQHYLKSDHDQRFLIPPKSK